MTLGRPDADPRIRRLERRFRQAPTATLEELQRLLHSSGRTVLRVLDGVGYMTSYSHAGRYYTLSHIPAFDDTGLWFSGDVCFSRHRTLRATVVVLVKESTAGHTHEELQTVLRLRVHDTLRSLVEEMSISRERVTGVYVYLHPDREVASAQLTRRRQLVAPAVALPLPAAAQLDPLHVIDVLVAVIHAPKEDPHAIAARLRAAGLGVSDEQVEAVFAQYGLQKKTARSRSKSSRR